MFGDCGQCSQNGALKHAVNSLRPPLPSQWSAAIMKLMPCVYQSIARLLICREVLNYFKRLFDSRGDQASQSACLMSLLIVGENGENWNMMTDSLRMFSRGVSTIDWAK